MVKRNPYSKIIKTWALIGIEDFYLSFVLGKNWSYQRAFFSTARTGKNMQGLSNS